MQLGQRPPASPGGGLRITRSEQLHKSTGLLSVEDTAEVLVELPEDLRLAVLPRLVEFNGVAPAVLDTLEDTLAKAVGAAATHPRPHDGAAAVVEIMLRASRPAESILSADLEQLDPELAAKVRDNMFLFEDLATLTDRDLQVVLRDTDKPVLAMAMRGVAPALLARIQQNMSERARQLLTEDIEALGPQPRAEVEAARATIVTTARTLADNGTITNLSGRRAQEQLI